MASYVRIKFLAPTNCPPGVYKGKFVKARKTKDSVILTFQVDKPKTVEIDFLTDSNDSLLGKVVHCQPPEGK
jgi:hypothetical protein